MKIPAQNRFTAKARDTLAAILQHILVEECMLSAKTKDYRWNVTGPNFHSLHKLFDEQRRQLDHWLDIVFQRTRAAGVAGREGIDQLARTADAAVTSGANVPPQQMINDLLTRHEGMARKLRDDVTRLADPSIVDVLRSLADFHDTTAWMLRILLTGPSSARV